jgi:hypothetical protein
MKKHSFPGSKAGGQESASGPALIATDGWQRPARIDAALRPSSLPVSLDAGEARQLQECEAVIETGWHTFVEVGRALTIVREKRLYRDHYETFEAYCRTKWEFSKTHANRLIGAAQVVEVLTPLGVKIKREAQVRPLIGLDPQDISSAWRRAEGLAENEEVTAKHVRLALDESPSIVKTRAAKKTKKIPVVPRVILEPALKLIERAELAAGKKDTETVLLLLAKLRKKLLNFKSVD